MVANDGGPWGTCWQQRFHCEARLPKTAAPGQEGRVAELRHCEFFPAASVLRCLLLSLCLLKHLLRSLNWQVAFRKDGRNCPEHLGQNSGFYPSRSSLRLACLPVRRGGLGNHNPRLVFLTSISSVKPCFWQRPRRILWTGCVACEHLPPADAGYRKFLPLLSIFQWCHLERKQAGIHQSKD